MNQAGKANIFNSYIPTANAGLNNAAKTLNAGLNNMAKNLNTGFNNASKTLNAGLNNATRTLNTAANALNIGNSGSGSGGSILKTVGIWILITLIASIGVLIFFYNEIMDVMPEGVQEFGQKVRKFLGIEGEAAAPPAPAPAPLAIIPEIAPPSTTGSGDGISIGSILDIPKEIAGAVEKQLPGQKKMEVFHIKENKYTYDDAEPLCKAMGAELATYEQVKEAWDAGADWCSYGWVQGQMAAYPTQDATYEKLQKGAPSQRNSCGKVGVNGGFFDNPDLKFGVNCYGVKPAQKGHDATLLPSGEAYPYDPDALEFDKKVSVFKAEADNIGVLPFKPGDWSEF